MKDELTPALRKMASAKGVNAGLSKIATQVKVQAKKNLRLKRKYNSVITNTGDLAKSVEKKKVRFLHYKIQVTEPYGVFVHQGTRPHRPPFKPISQWVARKLKIKSEPANFLVTRAIVRNIEKHGTKPKPFLLDALKEVATKKTLTKVIGEEIAKEMGKK